MSRPRPLDDVRVFRGGQKGAEEIGVIGCTFSKQTNLTALIALTIAQEACASALRFANLKCKGQCVVILRGHFKGRAAEIADVYIQNTEVMVTLTIRTKDGTRVLNDPVDARRCYSMNELSF